MAYLDYRMQARHRTPSAKPAGLSPHLAWERLAVVAVSLGAWAAILLAVRALF
jgi:hypothetical protein